MPWPRHVKHDGLVVSIALLDDADFGVDVAFDNF